MSGDLVGSRLAHFELTARLGRGGMGEVYLATDTRLGREVAIKVVTPDLAHRPDFRARLEREAKAVSRLNHPNICTLHDIGTEGDTTYLVLERVEGRALDDRLREGPLPRKEALRLAGQIASALAAAHERGLVHRDLKPANVMLTAEGAKLLDFGLAKAVAPDPTADPSREPTLAMSLTGERAVVGTPQYMAPEQITGGAVDPRSDLFAFGALLYEMLSGVRAFPAASPQEAAAAVLKHEPEPLDNLVPGLTPSLTRLVHRCLAKEPGSRWQCAADLAEELRWIAAEETPAAGGKGAAASRRKLWMAAGAAAVLAGAAGLFAGGRLAHRNAVPLFPPLAPAPTHLSIVLPETAPFLPVARSALDISPDGRRIVYVGGDIVHKRLYLRPLRGSEVQALDGTEDAEDPFFSPDGSRIGFFTRYDLCTVSANGGLPQKLSFTPPVTRGGAWLPDGDILLVPSKASNLYRLTPDREDSFRQAAAMDSSLGNGLMWPSPFAGGTKVLVTVIGPADTSFDQADIVGIDLDTGRHRMVVEGGTQARYLSTGHLVFVRNGSLFAAGFDPDTMRLTSAPVSVLDGILTDPMSGAACLAIAPGGTLVYAPGKTVSSRTDLVWLDRSGAETPVPSPPREIYTPRISPDGNRIAVSIEAASDDVWIFDLVRGTRRRLTFGGRNILPIWTPDGSEVTFSAVRGAPEVYTLSADGSGHEQLLSGEGAGYFPSSWSPDGTILAMTSFTGVRGSDVVLVSPGQSVRSILDSRFNETAPAISPDGAWLAYCSDESGQWEVYATSFPEPGQKLQVSVGGGTQPVWARDGLELFYRAGSRLLSVNLEAGGELTAKSPVEVIHSMPHSLEATVPGTPLFDVAPDGRFLVVRQAPLPAVTRLEVVLDWFTELRRRAPLASAG